jgi:hypothetical protein
VLRVDTVRDSLIFKRSENLWRMRWGHCDTFASRHFRMLKANFSTIIRLALMSYLTNNDNIYKIGTTIFAKTKPDAALVIMRYYHRTYYCVDVSDATGKQREYFEKDLIPPNRKVA